MAEKLKRSIFAWIRDDWQNWSTDKNVVKKIFWFLWLIIWTILRVAFWLVTFIVQIFMYLNNRNHVDYTGKSGGGTCSICRHYNGRICSVTNTEKYEGASCSKFSLKAK